MLAGDGEERKEKVSKAEAYSRGDGREVMEAVGGLCDKTVSMRGLVSRGRGGGDSQRGVRMGEGAKVRILMKQ